MKDKDLLRLLKQDGWEIIRINGSHHVIQKGSQIEVIPVHNKDMPPCLLNKIMKNTGLK